MPNEDYEGARRAVAAGMSCEEAARALVGSLTPEERLWCLDGDLPFFSGLGHLVAEDGYHRAPFVAARLDRVGFPGIAFADGPRGSVLGNATCFPVTMARGATWDPELEERVGAAMGAELAAGGANITGAVCVNLLRHPAWGRAQETYGEDPHHVGEMGAALTRGLQRHVLACVKHFALNSMENARFKVDVQVDQVALHEVYLPHFRRIVDEGAASVMSAYNRVNGEWCGESGALLTDVLRGEWGFQGFVMSDWVFGVRDAATSLAAGLDVEMPARCVRYEHLPAALASGEASWADVDTAAARVLATFLRFDDLLSSPRPSPDVVGSEAHRQLAREVASRSVVLLRNDPVEGTPVLPLAAGCRVAVIGRLADVVNVGDAGSSDVWDLECRTVADGFRSAFASTVLDHGAELARAAGAAREADVAVVVVGYTREDEGEFMGDLDSLPQVFPSSEEPDVVARFEAHKETLPAVTRPDRYEGLESAFGAGGDRTSLRLPPGDVDLIRAVVAANPRTVVVIQAGSAVLCSEWADSVPALVQSWYGGAEAGPGLVDVLLGDVDASGRLPFSVPREEGHLPAFDRDAESVTYDRWHGWWHLARSATAPHFPFGYGLSYTTFAVRDACSTVERAAETIAVRGRLENTGGRSGTDVVQVYAELPDAGAPRRLVGFTRVSVPVGTDTPFEIEVPFARLATRDPSASCWRGPRGRHHFVVGRSACDPDAAHLDLDLGEA